ncbi:MAG: hypothetical protein WAN43_04250 [Rhodomicrobium sp.]
MQHQVRLGTPIYYVPNYDERLAGYFPVTRLHLSLPSPLVTVGHHFVIAPKPSADGNIARDEVGGYWISKDAYEAYKARRTGSLWRRVRGALSLDR